MKILIISHNPITTYQNMGKTFLSLVSSIEKKNLCQLYIYPSIPDIDKCNSYYRITDKDILSSYCRFGVSGKEISPEPDNHKMFSSEKDEQLYRNRKNKTAFRMLARDAMWKMSHWYNAALRRWLDKENPTCILVAPGTAKFLYDISLKISKERNIPIVSYICDDYYFVKKSNSLLGIIQQRLLHKKIEALLFHSIHLITICDELNVIYSEKFKTPAITIMTGTNYDIEKSVNVGEYCKTITYMGNIRCNRFYSLAEIGRTLDELNCENGTKYVLNIYSGEKDPTILSCFDSIKSINFCGFVSGEKFNDIFHSSEILLHTEAFDSASIDLVKHSVSTKIADSLGSGIPLIAYGPDSVSSMLHLVRNDCAIIITSKEQLKTMLRAALVDTNELRRVAENGLKTAFRYHDTHKTSGYFYDLMRKINEDTASK